LVTYNGKLYKCIQGHTSEPNWTPTVVPALWGFVGNC
jgi:chitin-binding protein